MAPNLIPRIADDQQQLPMLDTISAPMTDQVQPMALQTIRPQPPQPNQLPDHIERIREDLAAEQNKPAPTGFWGKAKSILGHVGDVAGEAILGPETMSYIKGTPQYEAASERNLERLEGEESEAGLRTAQGDEAEAHADALKNPPDKPDKYTFQQTDHGLMRIDSVTGEATPVTFNGQPLNPAEKPETPKGMEHVPLLGDDGKPMIGNYHPDTGKYTDAAGNEIANPRPVPPPPNYGQLVLPTKTATYLDAKGVPTEFQWNEKTQRYDIPVGQSATGGYGHEAAQAGAVERAGKELISDIEANRQNLGTLGAWVAKYGLNTPIADPKLAGLQAKMASFAALSPAMHGARGLHAMEHFEKLIGGLQQNPDASIAGIRGIIQTAGAINPGTENQGGNAPIVQHSASTGQYRYSTDGGKTWQPGQPKTQ